MSTLKINNLHVSIDDKEILKGIDLEINTGEIHAIMGPNGNGKSTLLSAIMGHPKYTVTKGSITLDGQDVLAMSVDERARAGLFLGMQYPQEIPGVTNSDFLKAAINARQEKPISLFKFIPSIIDSFGKNKKSEENKETATESKDSVPVVEQPVSDDAELIAVIAAAIAASENTTTDGFIVRSIRKR